MLFAVRFFDHPGKQYIRENYTARHRQYLVMMKKHILVAGMLADDASMWIVEAASKAEVEAIYQQDPFWQHGLRKSVELNVWKKAFPEIQVVI